MPRRLPRPTTPLLALTVTMLSGALLSGCGPSRDQFAPACPTANLVWEAADLTRYRDEANAANEDVRDLVLSAHIIAMPAKCQEGDTSKQLAADVGIIMRLERGPAMQGRQVDVPFFLAVTEGDRILDKKVYQTSIAFPPNVDQVTMSSQMVHMVFPVSPTKTGAAYTVLAGFQLTPDELAVNRHRNTQTQ